MLFDSSYTLFDIVVNQVCRGKEFKPTFDQGSCEGHGMCGYKSKDCWCDKDCLNAGDCCKVRLKARASCFCGCVVYIRTSIVFRLPLPRGYESQHRSNRFNVRRSPHDSTHLDLGFCYLLRFAGGRGGTELCWKVWLPSPRVFLRRFLHHQ